MEVILREDVDKLGDRGDIVKVADGYARNFLLPKRMAVAATEANKKIVEQERQAHLRREATERGEAQDLAKLLDGVTVTIAQKAGEMDQLFGSVTVKDIVEALEAQNFTIERRKIHLDEPIKQLGEHPVAVKLFRDVTAEIKVNVVREEEPEP
jgi:large subunit ribosomal protein L9